MSVRIWSIGAGGAERLDERECLLVLEEPLGRCHRAARAQRGEVDAERLGTGENGGAVDVRKQGSGHHVNVRPHAAAARAKPTCVEAFA